MRDILKRTGYRQAAWRMALGAALAVVAFLTLPPPAYADNQGFVVARDGEFWLAPDPSASHCKGSSLPADCDRFRFVGTNAYFLMSAATKESAGGKGLTLGMMALANDLNFGVIRTWGFKDGPRANYFGEPVTQPAPGVYDEEGLQALDFVVATANDHSVRLILTFTNFWEAYGGIEQYRQWCDPSSSTKTVFFTNSKCRNLYKRYVYTILNRINTVNGRLYKDDPTIFAWELMNEPRCQECANAEPNPVKKGDVVKGWLKEMACFIKSNSTASNGNCPPKDDNGQALGSCAQDNFGPTSVPCGAGDANHMVATGEEGFDCTKTSYVVSAPGYTDLTSIKRSPWMYDGSMGVCYTQDTALPGIDYGSAHLYPEYWRLSTDSATIRVGDHINIAKSGVDSVSGQTLRKPFVLGEYGSTRRGRETSFDQWLDAIDLVRSYAGYASSGDGSLIWQILCDTCTGYAGFFTQVPGRGIVVQINGQGKGTIAGADFARALWGIWLDAEPPNPASRRGSWAGSLAARARPSS